MSVNLEQLVGHETALKLRNLGLHKVAAARLRADGHDVPDELDLESAVRALGTNIFRKNAEYKRIHDGLQALEQLLSER